MRLVRYHGLGNDYLVLDSSEALTPELVVALCDRHTGVGSDGLLQPVPATDGLGVRIHNPDGSVAEKSGNGLRIFARWHVDSGGERGPFAVDTGFERVICEVLQRGVRVQMGTARFEAGEVPTRARGPLIDHPLQLEGHQVVATAVGLGNPHCVVFVAGDLDEQPWRAWGRQLERHALFPNRINVQIACVGSDGRLHARIWERGAGETRASGSSACAVVAAALRTGRIPPGAHTVVMPGGDLAVQIDEHFAVEQTGPVERIARLEVDQAWLAHRGFSF